MDMQGTPIGSTNQGMKNTSDPAAKEPIKEAAGPIAADSLAAESTREGGAFSENRDAAPSGVEGAKSTLANTDISAATTLAPAPDAAAREAKESWNETAELKAPAGVKFPEAVGGQADFPGTMSDTGYAGGPSSGFGGSQSATTSATGGIPSTTGGLGGSSASTGGVTDTATTAATSSSGAADASKFDEAPKPSVSPAPGYITGVVMANAEGKPKGTNLTEGGFDGEAPSNVEIGSSEDPSRLAEQSFQTTNAAAAGGDGPKQSGVEGTTAYDNLRSEERA